MPHFGAGNLLIRLRRFVGPPLNSSGGILGKNLQEVCDCHHTLSQVSRFTSHVPVAYSYVKGWR